MGNERTIRDLMIMIDTDTSSLVKAAVRGDRTEAHQLVDSIIELQQALEDLKRSIVE